MSLQIRDSEGAVVEEWDDDTRTYTDYRTTPPTTRPYTQEENDAADEEIQTDAIASLERRIEALELWRASFDPAPEEPVPGDLDVKTMEDWLGVWPNNTLLREGDFIYRNVSGTPLTTPPSGFPGSPGQWTHLFVLVVGEVIPDPEPEPEPGAEPWVQPTGAHDAYNIGDLVTYQGQTWRSTVDGNVWTPGVAGWEVV